MPWFNLYERSLPRRPSQSEKTMKFVVGLCALAAVLLAGCSSMPGSPTKASEQHAAHHFEGTAAASAPAGYEQQMKAMQEMHQKMAAAKTPGERTALMKDHLKAMQDGMGMMGQMGGGMMGGKGAMPMDPELMKRRMDMMEMMMQMMIDREVMQPPAPK